jgi:teichuronic acid biosynthesis glycosyltransferase TuaG
MPLYDNEIVSVITPVYNVEKVIGKTLESMIAQEYDDLEIVLVDDSNIYGQVSEFCLS